MKKPFWVGGVVLLIIISAVSFYFFAGPSRGGDLVMQKANLESRLSDSKNKLTQAQEKLNALRLGLETSFPLASGVQEQMRKGAGLVGQTDFIFIGANSSNPQLGVFNPLTGININAQRAEINNILSFWLEKTKLSYLKSIKAEESVKIKQETEKIKTYISDLLKIVSSLTPLNSGLTQSEIDAYAASLPGVEEVDGVLALLQSLIQADVGMTATPQPVVTPEAVVSQEQVVEGIQQEIENLQTEIIQVNISIQQQGDVPEIENTGNQGGLEESVPADTTQLNGSNPESEVPQEQGNTSGGSDPNQDLGVTGPSEGVSDPGQPQLIQGSNPY